MLKLVMKIGKLALSQTRRYSLEAKGYIGQEGTSWNLKDPFSVDI
jgi:hypothetical protein